MLYLYDIRVDILVKADKYQLSNLSFEFTNKVDDKIDLFDELERQRDVEISEIVFIPHIFFFNFERFELLSFRIIELYRARKSHCRIFTCQKTIPG